MDATGPPSLPSPADYREAGRVGSSAAAAGDRSLSTVTIPTNVSWRFLNPHTALVISPSFTAQGGGVMQPPRVWLLSELELRLKKPECCLSRDEAVNTRV